MTYQWPPEDNSLMKLILAEKPDGRSFRVLISRHHPIGDFDGGIPPVLPDESFRLYRTVNGSRIFFTGRFGEPPCDFLPGLLPLGLDPIYSKICIDRGYYAARVDPKNPGASRVAELLEQSGPVHPGWQKMIELHDSMTGAGFMV